ncbi:MAG TPA: NUDIX hydrolase [Burkholderiaceae bacterium]|nr:NUDIX hydrolase [Burkholderiaceae bacterium]
MKTVSCGILVIDAQAELLLGHATGTPYWDIPKGGTEPGESEIETALRETEEETGLRLEPAQLLELGRFAYRRDKDLHLFATLSPRVDPAGCHCSTRFVTSRGQLRPELDRFEWTAFDRVIDRCARSMATLLTRTISLPDVLQRLNLDRRALPD